MPTNREFDELPADEIDVNVTKYETKWIEEQPGMFVEEDSMIASPREELLATHEILCSKAKELMERKNHDYASTTDPFRNFRTFGRIGILVRMSDKLARLRSFEEQQKLKVTDETIEDTVCDIINYAILYYAYKDGTK